MGFIKSIGKAIKGVAKGVVKFAKSPIGKLLINVGLTALTGGAGGLLAKGLSMVGGLGKVGSLLTSFSGVASKFLGPVQSLLSKTGLGTVAGFLDKAGGSGDLLSMAKSLFQAKQAQPTQPDAATNDIALENLKQLFAYQQAQQLQTASAD